jgi:hypothetical protein
MEKRCLCPMSQQRSQQSKGTLQSIMLGHQLDYSFSQLRLLGMLMLAWLLQRLLALIWFGAQGDPLNHLHLIQQASQTLPLLPLAIALVLLGGGRQRLNRELFFIDNLRRMILPLALVCLVVLPGLTFAAQDKARSQLQQSEQALADLESRFERLGADLEQVQDQTALARIARIGSLEMPVNRAQPLEQTRRQLRRQMDRDLRAADQRRSGSNAYLAAQSLLPSLLFTCVFEQLITGVALVWMDRQGRRLIKRHGLSMTQFFHSDLVKGRSAGG